MHMVGRKKFKLFRVKNVKTFGVCGFLPHSLQRHKYIFYFFTKQSSNTITHIAETNRHLEKYFEI